MGDLLVIGKMASGRELEQRVNNIDSWIEILNDDNIENIRLNYEGEKNSLMAKVFAYTKVIMNEETLNFSSKRNLIVSFCNSLKANNNLIEL